MARVTRIDPTTRSEIEKKKVCAYCRVSRSTADQLNSYARQIRVYTDLIKRNPSWQLVEIFADEGITGTSVAKRPEFQRMLKMCEQEQIDLIITKSISRFARNTMEALEIVRRLKILGIAVQFEKEGIYTLSLGDEMLLNTFTAIAQEESIAISERIRYSNTKRMESGEFVDGNAPFGYRMVDRVLVPEESESQIVRDIFDQYLHGASTHEIARNLNEAGILGKFGNSWKATTIRYILRNEKYIGDMLCQKTYHTNTLPFMQKRNRGEADQYYVEGSHAGIVDKEVFDKVQEIINGRKVKYQTDAEVTKYPLTSKMHCTECGAFFIRKKTNGCISWVCTNHGINKDNCPTHYIREIRIYDAFIAMINKLRFGREKILEGAIKRLEEAIRRYRLNNADAYEISKQISEINAKLLMLEQLHQKQYLAADVYRTQSNELQVQVNKLKSQRAQMLNSKLEDTKNAIQGVLTEIEKINEPLEEFNESLFASVIDSIAIDKNDNIRFTLKGNISFTEEL